MNHGDVGDGGGGSGGVGGVITFGGVFFVIY